MHKDKFDTLDRIVIKQDIVDDYPYVDAVGTKLIEIQKIINRVDISNCFILLETANTDISYEIDFVTKFYSIDSQSIEFSIIDGNYKKTIKKYNDVACRKLWDHLYIGTDGNINPCCLADHRFPLGNIDSTSINSIMFNKTEQIRSIMSQGYRTRACAVCYEKEDCGIYSVRQVCDHDNQTVGIKHLDIRINNTCNFKCRMCSEYFSSAIQQETIKLYGKDAILGFESVSLDAGKNQNKNQRLQQVLPFVNSGIESIYFAGGEPLLMPEHYEILDHLIEMRHTDLAIMYNTNLSTLFYKKRNIIDLWKKFSNIQVGASIDAMGAVAEYMRHGTIWDNVINNINIIKQQVPHVKLKITSTVSCVTIENLIELQCSWVDQKMFCVEDLQVQVLTSPNFLSPAVLPQHHKDRLTNIIQQHICRFSGTRLAQQWYDVLQWMNNTDYTFALTDFKQRTSVLDLHRGESFVDIFPEFRDLL
jgi:MoaA/NifB/PqqE/SkfB family radical SAM enzyme